MKERIELIKTNWENGHFHAVDIDWLFEQVEKVERYENIIHAIANIDTIFMLPDGTDREWDDKEALEEIEKMVMPVWNEHCKESRKETDKIF